MGPVKSAQRTLAILELMERMRRPARVCEIAKLLGYPQSSASVLINSLQDLGYLKFNRETHEYAPSIRVALVGGYLRFDNLHAHQVLDLICDVRDRTGLTTILSTRNGVHVQYIYALAEPGRRMLGLRAGSMRPLTRASPGVMLLTACTDDEISRVARYLYEHVPNRDDRERFENVLAAVREAREVGYACVLRRLKVTAGSVAVLLPFRDSFGKQLALSVSGRAEKIDESKLELVEAMRSAIGKYHQPVPG
ncbi:MAG TPA: helix-turn-helix domain-containing protein [Steroidobacteraceae bacterium]|nr:helix-turn-helix domain-containing protein [Steroidobacteraceae bacterium]